MSKRNISYFSLLAFLASLHAFLTVYINSSVIAQEPYGIWLITPVFVVAYCLAIVGFFFAPRLLSRIGNNAFLLLIGTLEGIALFVLASSPETIPLMAALILHLVMAPLLGFSLDVYFENAMVDERNTGTARGFFLTFGNTALVLSPLILGVLAVISFGLVYFTSLIVLLLFLLAMIPVTLKFTDPKYTHPTVRGIISTATSTLGPVILSQLVLRIFYAFAAIFMPLLLISRGFSWEQIGIILGFALLPFMLFELPLGHAADKVLGEKEILLLGFVILGCATTLLTFVNEASVPLYALIFFATRTGASMIEITTETNFFRNVKGGDTSAITLFRMTTSIGGLCGVALGSIALHFVELPSLFAIFGLFVLIGIPVGMRIKDSR